MAEGKVLGEGSGSRQMAGHECEKSRRQGQRVTPDLA